MMWVDVICPKCGLRAQVLPSEERRGDVPFCHGSPMCLDRTGEIRRKLPNSKYAVSLYDGRSLRRNGGKDEEET